MYWDVIAGTRILVASGLDATPDDGPVADRRAHNPKVAGSDSGEV